MFGDLISSLEKKTGFAQNPAEKPIRTFNIHETIGDRIVEVKESTRLTREAVSSMEGKVDRMKGITDITDTLLSRSVMNPKVASPKEVNESRTVKEMTDYRSTRHADILRNDTDRIVENNDRLHKEMTQDPDIVDDKQEVDIASLSQEERVLHWRAKVEEVHENGSGFYRADFDLAA